MNLPILKYMNLPILKLFVPRQRSLVLFNFNKINLNVLDRILFFDLDCGIIRIHGEEYNISPVFIFKAFYFYVRYDDINLKYAYILSYLYFFNPKVVVTFLDNNNILGKLSRYLPKILFISIQNGYRPYQQVKNIKQLPVFYCFGQREYDVYTNCNIDMLECIPVGSLIMDYYYHAVLKCRMPEVKYDICLISQYRYQHNIEPVVSQLLFIKLCSYLNKYLSNKDLKVCVATVGGKSYKYEKRYFRKVFGDKVDLIECNRERFSSYEAMFKSELVVSSHSTMAIESFGKGIKTLFCAGLSGKEASKEWNFEKPNTNIMLCQSTKYEDFEDKIDALISLDVDNYRLITKKDRRYVFNNSDGGAHAVVRNRIIQSIV